jgi:catalase
MSDLPDPLPEMMKRRPKPEVQRSEPLSLSVRPGQVGIRTRRVAILVADGVDGAAALEIHRQLMAEGAVPRFVGIKLGQAQSSTGEPVEIEVSMETMPSVLWDGVIIPSGDGATAVLSESGHALEFLKDQYRHCKTMLLMGRAGELLTKAGIPTELASGENDTGLLRSEAADTADAIAAFIEALGKHRHFERETDPPRV